MESRWDSRRVGDPATKFNRYRCYARVLEAACPSRGATTSVRKHRRTGFKPFRQRKDDGALFELENVQTPGPVPPPGEMLCRKLRRSKMVRCAAWGTRPTGCQSSGVTADAGRVADVPARRGSPGKKTGQRTADPRYPNGALGIRGPCLNWPGSEMAP